MKKAGDLIEKAINKTLDDGYRTVDIMSEGCKLVPTDKMTEYVIQNFKEIYHNQGISVVTL
jgi:3-isopropylmalate dehydrogenase